MCHPEEHALRVRVVVRRALRTGRAGTAGPSRARRRRAFRFPRAARLVGAGQLADPAQAARGRQHDAHQLPAIGNRMAERMHGRRGVRHEAIADHAQHAGRAERHEAVARVDRADAERTRRVVAAAACHHDGLRQPEFACDVRAQRAGWRVAFDDAGHLVTRHPARGEQRIGPVAARDVEPQRAGGVRRIGHLRAGQPEPQVVLRHQHAGGCREHVGFVLRDPQQFRRGEARHREVAGQCVEIGRAFGEQRAFVGAAHVVPQDRGRSTRSSRPSSTAPCIWPDRPMPRTAANASRCRSRSAASAASVPCHQSSGCCSAQRGCGRDTVNGEPAVPTTVPSGRAAAPSLPRCRGRCRDT